jgi:type IV pilus assembly protein PilA
MLTAIKARLAREDREEGFTLIELMVVVLIIAILLAIAIPTFLGARNTANARAAQSNIRNALTAEQTYFTNNNQVYGSDVDVATIEPALGWEPFSGTGVFTLITGTGAPTNQVGVQLSTSATGSANDTVLLAAVGKDNNCYYANDVSGSITYASNAVGAGGVCTAPATSGTGSTFTTTAW